MLKSILVSLALTVVAVSPALAWKQTTYGPNGGICCVKTGDATGTLTSTGNCCKAVAYVNPHNATPRPGVARQNPGGFKHR